MTKLIVHADDFGLTEKVNEGIYHAHCKGILTSASIMASGEAFDDAIQIIQSTPTLDIGVHLTLVEERPVSSSIAVPSLVNKYDRFPRHATEFVKEYMYGRIHLKDIEIELDQQIQKVIDHGVSISHLDSHQHIHMLPNILDITLKLAKKYHIPSVRIPREKNRMWTLLYGGSVVRFLQSVVLNGICSRAKILDANPPDYFIGFMFSGKLNKKNLHMTLHHLPSRGTCELMCHPGLNDPGGKYSHWGYESEEELNALIDPETISFVKNKNIVLTSYRDLILK